MQVESPLDKLDVGRLTEYFDELLALRLATICDAHFAPTPSPLLHELDELCKLTGEKISNEARRYTIDALRFHEKLMHHLTGAHRLTSFNERLIDA